MRKIFWKTGFTGSIMTLTLALGIAGCKSSTTPPANIVDANNGPDPAAANMAPVDPNAAPLPASNGTSGTTAYAPAPTRRVLGARSSSSNSASSEQYPENAPQQQSADPNYGQQSTGSYDPDYDQYENQVDGGQQALYAEQPPPPLPTYEQPELTEPGYQWTPGYWNYGNGGGGYYWVPGAWVAPPYQGALWTPGYWGQDNNRYQFHRGFWARHIGYYGGINYGFGYGGSGYDGGYWNNNQFYYNNSVNRIDYNNVRTVYTRNVTNITTNNYSYNGRGGTSARPRPQELAVLREQRTPPMQVQTQRVQAASQNRQQFFAANHGKPAVAVATQHLAADRVIPQAIPQRGGFGQQNNQQHPQPVQQQQQSKQQQQQQQQNQARQQEQQHTQQQAQQQNQARQQEQQRTHQAQQAQQRTQQEQQQQRTQQAQQQNQQKVQQQNQARQQEQQRTQQAQQQQQRTQQAQQQNQVREQQQQRTQQQTQEKTQQQNAARQQQAQQQNAARQQQAQQQNAARQQQAQQHAQQVQHQQPPHLEPHPQPAQHPAPAQQHAAPQQHEAAPHPEEHPKQ